MHCAEIRSQIHLALCGESWSDTPSRARLTKVSRTASKASVSSRVRLATRLRVGCSETALPGTHLGVPVRVVDDDRVCRRQRDALPAGAGGEKEDCAREERGSVGMPRSRQASGGTETAHEKGSRVSTRE